MAISIILCLDLMVRRERCINAILYLGLVIAYSPWSSFREQLAKVGVYMARPKTGCQRDLVKAIGALALPREAV
jgi:hypothetical protein